MYFDTSIFLEIATKRSKYKPKIKALLKELSEEHVKIYTSIITVQEVSVAAYRPGDVARDTYGDINAIAKIQGIDKNIALTSAKREAELKHIAEENESKRDKSKPETEEQRVDRICENRRRKWDCFHLATAQILKCSELYSTDEKLLKRPTQLGIKGLRAVLPGTSLKKISGPLVKDAGEIPVE